MEVLFIRVDSLGRHVILSIKLQSDLVSLHMQKLVLLAESDLLVPDGLVSVEHFLFTVFSDF